MSFTQKKGQALDKVLQYAKLNNMKRSKYKKQIDEKLKVRAFKLYQSGLSTRDVGKIVSRSHQWVAYVVREKGAVDKGA